jgi:gas vesicle protein
MTSTTTGWDAIQKKLDSMPKPTQTLHLCSDPEIRDRYQQAKQVAQRAEDHLKSLSKDADKDALALVRKQTREAQDALAKAQADYDEHTVVLTFQALERGALEALIKEHPPTEEDEERDNNAEFHFNTFAPALLAASSVDGMPVEYAQHAMQTWALDDWKSLWGAAWLVQQRKRTDLGKG